MVRISLAAVAMVWALSAVQSASAQNDEICRSLATQAERSACAQEIAEEANPDRRADLLYRRAYANNETEHYEEAVADLGLILQLHPNNVPALRERAYAFNALERYAEAEADMNAQTPFAPSDLSFYQERAFARFYQGNLEGTLADREGAVEASPNDWSPLAARAEAHMWLGQWDAARNDIDAASALARGVEAERRVNSVRASLELWSTPTANGDAHALCDLSRISGADVPANIMGDCTALFLAATNGQERGDALTVRSVAFTLAQDTDDSVIDLQIAAALDPQNWQRHANLGQSFLSARRPRAARNEFNLALAMQSNWVSLSGRAAANFSLGDTEAASRDARQAMRQHANLQAAMVLGDIAFGEHNNADARRYWLQAYQLGSRDDSLIERLRQIGVTDPEHTRR